MMEQQKKILKNKIKMMGIVFQDKLAQSLASTVASVDFVVA